MKSARCVRRAVMGSSVLPSGQVGDLLLSLQAIKNGLLVLPFSDAVATGDGYYYGVGKKYPPQKEYRSAVSLVKRLSADSARQGVTLPGKKT